jgi:ATP-binding cassette subfamily B (MDR/TAP) protein 1
MADKDNVSDSVRLMYSTLQGVDQLLFVPGFLLAILAGLVPTLSAKVIGGAFEAFIQYQRDVTAIAAEINATNSVDAQLDVARHALSSGIGTAIWQYCALAGGTLLLSTSMISTWVIIGEKVAFGWRRKVYEAMDSQSLAWFEAQLPRNMDSTPDANLESEEEEGTTDLKPKPKRALPTVGAGGIMARFARETDEIRVACSQTAGQMVESASTVVSALILALISSWSLALIVLSVMPLLMIFVRFVQKSATKWHIHDMESMANAGKVLEQTVQSIGTVKALTIEARQIDIFMKHIRATIVAWDRLALVYGFQAGVMNFMALMMFAGGFWYGGYGVQRGTLTPSQVFTTFWACAMVSNTVPGMVQNLTTIKLGKVAAAGLVRLTLPGKKRASVSLPAVNISGKVDLNPFDDPTARSDPIADHLHTPRTPTSPYSASSLLRKTSFASRSMHKPYQSMKRIWPDTACQGEVSIQNVSFSYPSRPDEMVLQNVSLFIPAGEMTFIVGASGSGKSTISHLLLGLYTGYAGTILVDDQDVSYLDKKWTRANVAGIDQIPIIFDMSVHDNVALGLCGDPHEDQQRKANHVPRVTRKRVIDACKKALIHQDIARMANGYDTLLGLGGIDLSGGQKQRIALARAILRDPTVLILDEATSALDITNRTLIMALIRRWRRGKTTIIITHDFSQIDVEDFVYVLEHGRLVEQGYRADLETRSSGKFSSAKQVSQFGAGMKDEGVADFVDSHGDVPTPTGLDYGAAQAVQRHSRHLQHVETWPQQHHGRASRWGINWMFGEANYAVSKPSVSCLDEIATSADEVHEVLHVRSSHVPQPTQAHHMTHARVPSSISTITSSSSRTASSSSGPALRPLRLAQDQQIRSLREQGTEGTLAASSVAASQRRPDQRMRRAWTSDELDAYAVQLTVDNNDEELYGFQRNKSTSKPDRNGWIFEKIEANERDAEEKTKQDTFMSLLRLALGVIWRTQPRKLLFVAGLFAAAIAGAVQPCYSYVLARLLATMGTADQSSSVLRYSLAVIGLAFADGLGQSIRFALLQLSANRWIMAVRDRAIVNVLSQDKSWFDAEENDSATLITRVVKDPEDAKSFISRIVGEVVILVVNISVVFTWAFVVSWQLTLAGLAIGPILYLVIVLQGRAVLHYEKQNKLQRERVSKRFYTMVRHAREIRAMGLHDVFRGAYLDSVRWTRRNGIRAAPINGLGYGIKDACIYASQAFLNYIGSVLLRRGQVELASLFIVMNLILFGVSFASHVLMYIPNVSKCLKAVQDVQKILRMDPKDASDSAGYASPRLQGFISFRDVSFAYPNKPSEKVLDKCSFDVTPGERVALVGASGCGKSTVVALLQRLYEPSQPGGGAIILDGQWPLHAIQAQHLRSQMACVSQRSDLFDESIRDNLTLSNSICTESRIWQALSKACCDDFIALMDEGIETQVGENAGKLSGGQKQRLAIARALVRDQARIRLLDECTSALDPHNQEQVATNLLDVQQHVDWFDPHVTTLIVTHKIQLMRRCDRILVLDGGKVVQTGTFDQLIAQKGGAFSKLASAGEWGA